MDEDMINNLSSMLKNGNIPDNIKDILSNISNSSTNTESSSNSSSNNIDPNIISSLFSSFNKNSSDGNSESTSNIDIETILKMKTIIDKMNKKQNDPRANLLRSLKPYLRNSRQDKLDQYVKLLSMTNVMEAFGMSGGDKKKNDV